MTSGFKAQVNDWMLDHVRKLDSDPETVRSVLGESFKVEEAK